MTPHCVPDSDGSTWPRGSASGAGGSTARWPGCSRLEDQVKLWPLLRPERIGVSLTEQFQLEPEQTTTTLIVHHRQAKYLTVR